jgi:TP901 family phage tail tape measure protein
MSTTVGLGIAITLADMFTPKLAKAEKGFARFTARLSAASTASVALGNKLSAKIGSYYETFADVAQKQGDLMSLGLSERAIRIVDAAAMEFSNRYSGYTRAAFEGAAYDIKSGISSLTEEGVAQMTKYSLLTAKATKASAETMGKAFALGYGIFRDEFGSDMEFGRKFSATFSAAVQQFRTDGDDLARGMSNVGAMAKSMGVSLAQEYAIIGTAKDAFDSASEAGTSYKAFLMGALNAQKKLGMRFTDANGKMLPMVEILEKIRRKFGDLDANEIGLLKKYFGSDEAVKIITALIPKIDKLREAEAKLKSAQEKGIGYTEQMAQARNYGQEMVLLRQQGENLAYMFGKALAPAVGWVAKKFGYLVKVAQQWMSRHGELATKIATGVTAFAALATILGTVGVGVAAISFGLGALGIRFGRTGKGARQVGEALCQSAACATSAQRGIASAAKTAIAGAGAILALGSAFVWLNDQIAAAGQRDIDSKRVMGKSLQKLKEQEAYLKERIRKMKEGGIIEGFLHGRATPEQIEAMEKRLEHTRKRIRDLQKKGRNVREPRSYAPPRVIQEMAKRAGLQLNSGEGTKNAGGKAGRERSMFPPVATPSPTSAGAGAKQITIHEGDIHISVTGVTDPKQVADMVMRRLAAHQRDKRDRSVLS